MWSAATSCFGAHIAGAAFRFRVRHEPARLPPQNLNRPPPPLRPRHNQPCENCTRPDTRRCTRRRRPRRRSSSTPRGLGPPGRRPRAAVVVMGGPRQRAAGARNRYRHRQLPLDGQPRRGRGTNRQRRRSRRHPRGRRADCWHRWGSETRWTSSCPSPAPTTTGRTG